MRKGVLAGQATWWLLGVASVFFLLVRLHLLDIPLERDEGDYAYHAQLLLEGVSLHDDIVVKRMTLIYYTFMPLLLLFGYTAKAIHLGLLLANVLSAFLVYRIAREWFGLEAGKLSALFFITLSASYRLDGFAANREHFVVLGVLGSVWLWQKSKHAKPILYLLLSGLAMGLAFLYKPSAAFVIATFGLVIVLQSFLQEKAGWKKTIQRGLLYSAGFFIPVALVLLQYQLGGSFEAFWMKSFTINKAYAEVLSGEDRWLNLVNNGGTILVFCWMIVLAGVAGLVLSAVRWRSWNHVYLLLIAAGLFYGVTAGGYYRSHYFLLAVPVLAIGAATALVALQRIWNAEWIRLGIVVLVVGMVGQPIYSQWQYYMATPVEACKMRYGANPFTESVAIGEYIKQITHPDDRIFVLGSEPQIYFWAQRKSVSDAIYMYDLTQPTPLASERQRQLIATLEKEVPPVIIMVNVNTSWLLQADSDRTLMDWINQQLPVTYSPVMVCEILPQSSQFIVQPQLSTYKVRSNTNVIVFRKNG